MDFIYVLPTAKLMVTSGHRKCVGRTHTRTHTILSLYIYIKICSRWKGNTSTQTVRASTKWMRLPTKLSILSVRLCGAGNEGKICLPHLSEMTAENIEARQLAHCSETEQFSAIMKLLQERVVLSATHPSRYVRSISFVANPLLGRDA